MPIELTERQKRLLDAVLILGAIALGFVVLNFAGSFYAAFGDLLLTFFLAWLLSFALQPLISLVQRVVPRLGQAGAVIIVYLSIVGLLLLAVIQAAAALVSSIDELLNDLPNSSTSLTNLLTELQARLAGLGFQINLAAQVPTIVAVLQDWAGQLVGPLQSLAVASIGVLGSILIVVILSIYIAIDRQQMGAFLLRLVPPSFGAGARLLDASVSRSFSGFLKTQLVMGVAFGIVAAIVDIVFGLPYSAVTIVGAGLLHAIPFFGPFISWAPPVLVALLFRPDAVLPVLLLMGIGWFVTMNVLQPRLMSGAVGIHPIVVLASVLIGSKIAGIAGAIFGIPIAAVVSAMFFAWFERSQSSTSVADRAARRLERREGREIRRPREPVAGQDQDVDEVVDRTHQAHPLRPAPDHGAQDAADAGAGLPAVTAETAEATIEPVSPGAGPA